MGIFSNIVDSVGESLENYQFECNFGNNITSEEITYDDINYWKYSICKNLLKKYYQNFNPKKLEMIVIGSSGKWRNNCGFNNALAMVQEDDAFGMIPFTVQNLLANFNYAFKNCNSNLIIPKNQSQRAQLENFDLKCLQLMNKVLFINVCLSNDNSDIPNALCSIEFINQLLVAEKEFGNKLAVLDFRLTKHTHFNNENNFEDDSWLLSYNQVDPMFKIVPANYHRYYRFCHPAYILPNNNNERVSEKFVSMFRNIDMKGYPIKKMYMPYGKTW